MQDGLLEEAFLHEASHTSLDREHASSKGWLAAVQADGGNFISDYAQEYPQGEDIAETFPICFAVQYKPERLKKSDIEKIKKSSSSAVGAFDFLAAIIIQFNYFSV